MREKVIGLKVKLVGEKTILKNAEKLGDKFEIINKALTELGKNDAFQKLNKELKDTSNMLNEVLKNLDKVKNNRPNQRRTTRRSSSNATRNNNPSTDRTATVSSIKKEIQALKEAGKSYDDLLKMVAKTKQEQTELNKEIRNQQREFEKTEAAAGSYRQLNAQLVLARDQFRQLGVQERNSKVGRDILANVRMLDKELKDLDKDMGLYFRNVGNYVSAWNGLSSVALRISALLGLATSLDDIVSSNAEISDSAADVAKTTSLAADEVQRLTDLLKTRDTRTSLAQQLGIAEIGGRLGIRGVQNLFEFANAIDVVNVALGDQFNNDAEQVTNTLGKLRNVLSDIQTEDQANDILRLGNALNVLETQGPAAASRIADITGRIAGVAIPFGASTESVLGLATAIDELGINVERGGTAAAKLLSELAQAPEKFGEAVVEAKLVETTEEFIDLVQTDIVTALGLVARATQETSSSNTQLATTFDELGLSGAGNSETLAKLGTGYEILEERIMTASDALQSTQSLYDEFEKKNNNLAAAIEKARNAIINLTVNSDVQSFLTTGINGFSNLVAQLSKLPSFIKENRIQFMLLVGAILSFKIAAFITQIGKIRQAYILWSAATKGQTIAQKLLNVAMKANPIGLVVTAVFTLIGALVTLYQNSETFRNGLNNLTANFLDFYNSNLLVRLILFQIIEPLKLIFGLIQEGPSYFVRLKNASQLFFQNLLVSIQEARLRAQKFGLTVQKFFTFNREKHGQLIEDIKRIDEEIAKSDQRITSNRIAFQKKEIERQKMLSEKAKEKAREDVKTEMDRDKEIINLRKLTSEQLLKIANGENQQLAALAQRELQRRKDNAERARKIAEQAAKKRLEAAKNIAKLEAEAISNEFDRAIAKARLKSNEDIASLIGSKDQIARQTELIKQALDNQIKEIEAKRLEAQEKAIEQVKMFSAELAKVQVENGANRSNSQLSFIDRQFSLDQTRIENVFAISNKLLRDQLDNQEITFKEYAMRVKEITKTRDDGLLMLEQERAVSTLAILSESSNNRIAQLELEFEQEKMLLEQQRIERNNLLGKENEAGNLDDEQLEEGVSASDELARNQEIAALQKFEDAKLKILAETAAKSIELQKEVTEKELQSRSEKLEKLKAIQAQERKSVEQLVNSVNDLVEDAINGEIDSVKDFNKRLLIIGLDALEKTVQLAIAQVSAREIGTKGFAGIATGAILSGVIKATFSAAKIAIARDSLEKGGTLDRDGVKVGKPHANGGIKINPSTEIEGGEFSIRNGNLVHIINKKSTELFKPELTRLASISPHNIYSPIKHQMASAINGYNGFGVTLNEGGNLFNNTPSLPAPNPVNLNVDVEGIQRNQEQILELMQMVQSSVSATNSRIDRIQVVNKAEDTFSEAQRTIQLRNQNSLNG